MHGVIFKTMSEETEEIESDAEAGAPDEAVPKRKFQLKMPSPIVFIFVGPFILVFAVYIILTRVFLSSDLDHEQKLEQVLKIDAEKQIAAEEQLDGESAGNQDDAGFLDMHNYFQFPMSFAVNVPNTSKNLTFELAVSSFQSGVTAEWFFESFTAFVPALRSDILYFMGGHSLEDLQSPEFQARLLLDLKDVINAKLESLGAKPEISKVLFITFVVT